MMHVRGRAASKDDLELARRSALTQEKISFGVTHIEPMGGYGRPKSTVSKKHNFSTHFIPGYQLRLVLLLLLLSLSSAIFSLLFCATSVLDGYQWLVGATEAAGDGADPAADAPEQRAREAAVCAGAAESASISTSQRSGAACHTGGSATDATRPHLAGSHRRRAGGPRRRGAGTHLRSAARSVVSSTGLGSSGRHRAFRG